MLYEADKYYIKFKENLEKICNKYYDREVITYILDNDAKESIHFSELYHLIQEIKQKVVNVGVKPGDRVAIVAPSMPNTFIACLSMAYSNITTVILDASLPNEEILRLLSNADVSCIFTVETIYACLNQMLEDNMPVFNIGNSLGEVSLFEMSVDKVHTCNNIERQPDVIAILYSSGTTNSMKGVMITYQSIMESEEILADIFGVKSGMTYLSVLPLNHIAGYDSSIMFLLSGCGIGMIENVNASKLHKGLLKYNPNYFGMVPKVYDVMAEKIISSIREKGKIVESVINGLLSFCGYLRKHWNIKLGKILFKPIYKKVFGKSIWGLATMGTVCKESTAKLFLNMGIEWANVYASTETNAPMTSTGVYDFYPVNSVGNVSRYKNIKIRIKEPNDLGIGEVQVKSSLIMKGYFKDPELTAESFEDGYFKTGDLGYIDKDNNLFITGRIKETIILHNGEKVSVNDIDSYYGKVCPDIQIASCGIKTNDDFEEIHLFIEQGNLPLQKVEKYKNELWEKAFHETSIYKLAGIHIVEQIPVTSVGKVKRYLLKEMVTENEVSREVDCGVKEDTFDRSVFDIVKKICSSGAEITNTSKLREDLGFDSLRLFELSAEIERKLNVSITEKLQNIETVEDLIRASSETDNGMAGNKKYNIMDFPKEKTDGDIRFLKRFKFFTEKIWKFEVVNANVVLKKNRYILCPNHESFFDGLWVATALQKENVDMKKFCCMAAEHLMYKRWTKKAFFALGGIPVDRKGNSVLSTERAISWLKRDNCIMLIHPEGTRSRSGKMGEFKLGAAKLAIGTNTEIIPVCIKGAYEIYPPSKRFPKIIGKKDAIQIEFGGPINPKGKSEVEITQEMREQIERMKGI